MSLKLAIAAQALAVAAVPAPAPAEDIKVPLASRVETRQANGEANPQTILASLNSTMHKYHAANVLPTYPGVHSLLGGILKRQSNLALTDQNEQGEDILYYGPGTVGSQGFTFDFDTGSSDLFVPGPKCGTAQGCKPPQYDNSGVDEGNTTSVTYGSGMITGENFLDDVTVAGLTATKQNVISLTSAQGFNTSASNSLLGMGFSTIAQSMMPTFFENLISQGKVKTQEFAFYLGRAASGTQDRSELTLGGRDTSRFSGAITKVPVTKKGYWQVAVDQVDVSGFADPVDTALTKGQAAIDTGTTLVIAPTAAATAIFARIPGSFPIPLVAGSTTLFAFPCNTKKEVELVFAGQQFAINPLDLSLGTLTQNFGIAMGDNALTSLITTLTDQFCVAGIAGADLDPTQNLYVVGDTFLKNWYSIYNYVNNGGQPSVNFAKAV